ncbi:hypothetical protein GIB67_015015 [Kingdonia uniflora]|uniref:Uncharacterized protein n=1 Tax=Kingdonia uniflora TaxID=39325 RepID=A0A7J7MTH6_9MAGN|nr:hypothetical protein GIB67_015015 [Kingdonia uniflora]
MRELPLVKCIITCLLGPSAFFRTARTPSSTLQGLALKARRRRWFPCKKYSLGSHTMKRLPPITTI